MKSRLRVLSLLLSVMMLLTLMPAMAFADDGSSGKTPVSVGYTSPEPLTGTIGKDGGDVYADVMGAELTVKYSDGSSETYKYLGAEWDEETGEWLHDSGWYPGGSYENGSVYFWLNVKAQGRLKEGENECTLEVQDDFYNKVSCPVTVIGMPSDYVISVSYNHVGGDLKGSADYYDKRIGYLDSGYDEDNKVDESWKELEGDTITIKVRAEQGEVYNEETNSWDMEYAEETTVYTCKLYQYDWSDDYAYAFVAEKDDGEGGTYTDTIYPEFYDDQINGEWTWYGKGTGDVTVAYDGVDAPQKLKVTVPAVKAIKKAEIITAPGFEPNVSIGQDDGVNTRAFAAKGNKIVITFLNGEEVTLAYDPEEDEFLDSTHKCSAEINCNLEEKGIVLQKGVPTELSFTVDYMEEQDDEYFETQDESICNYTVTAKKWLVYADVKTDYVYTGKLIKPKAVLRTIYGDQKVPAEAFKIDTKGFKSIGWHWYDIKILDTDNYAAEYFYGDAHEGTYQADSITNEMVICPKRPVGKKPSALKKGFTAKWKKLSKAAQKNVDGIIIEYSTHKNFDYAKTKYAKKGASSFNVTKLKGKKTYYVHYFTYKKVKTTWYDENGKRHTYTSKIWSNPSKTFTVKTR